MCRSGGLLGARAAVAGGCDSQLCNAADKCSWRHGSGGERSWEHAQVWGALGTQHVARAGS